MARLKWIVFHPIGFTLSSLDFYVADCAQSNFSQTELSLASSLNFYYLDKSGDNFIPGNTDRYDLGPLIRYSQLRLMLDGMGYGLPEYNSP